MNCFDLNDYFFFIYKRILFFVILLKYELMTTDMFKEVVQTKDLLLGHHTGNTNRGINNTIEQKTMEILWKNKICVSTKSEVRREHYYSQTIYHMKLAT